MKNNSDEALSETEYNEILRKLNALLLEHQGRPDGSAQAKTGDFSDSPPASVSEVASDQGTLTAADNIPTLTEAVYPTLGTQLPPLDVTALLDQILDSAVREAGAQLDERTRRTLIQALESRLFGP